MRNLNPWAPTPDFIDPHLCSVDPITAIGGGLLAGAATSLFGSKQDPSPAPAPQQAPAPPPAEAPQGTAKRPKQQSTFIGNVPTAPTNGGSKTLLGQ